MQNISYSKGSFDTSRLARKGGCTKSKPQGACACKFQKTIAKSTKGTCSASHKTAGWGANNGSTIKGLIGELKSIVTKIQVFLSEATDKKGGGGFREHNCSGGKSRSTTGQMDHLQQLIDKLDRQISGGSQSYGNFGTSHSSPSNGINRIETVLTQVIGVLKTAHNENNLNTWNHSQHGHGTYNVHVPGGAGHGLQQVIEDMINHINELVGNGNGNVQNGGNPKPPSQGNPPVTEKPLAPETHVTPANQNKAHNEIPRISTPAYGDGKSTMGGQERPNPRDISNEVSNQNGEVSQNQKGASSVLWSFGQFVDHDVVATKEGDTSANISVPKGDSTFDRMGTGQAKINFTRSDQTIGKDGVAHQTNEQTPYVDGSQIYGADKTIEDTLRSFDGGKLKLSDTNDLIKTPDGKVLAGDGRANEQPGLESLHTLFVREHNRLADAVSDKNKGWTDQQVFTEAKRLNVMQLQHITYNEFLPTLLGDSAPAPSTYVEGTDGRISSEFSSAAYRIGHTMVNDTIDVKQADGTTKSVRLAEVFFNRNFTAQNGVGNILAGQSNQMAESVDPLVVDSIRNALMGAPGPDTPVLDLVSLNIQRGRDHGTPSYNDMREAIGMDRIESFDDPIFQSGFGAKMASVYSHPDQVDLWIGGLAEKPDGNSMVGQTFNRIIADQFFRTMAADPNFYTNIASASDLAWLNTRDLGSIINNNSHGGKVDNTVFYANDAHA